MLELSIALFLLMCFSLLIAIQYTNMLTVYTLAQHHLALCLYSQSIVAQLRAGQAVPKPLFFGDIKIAYTLYQPYKQLRYRSILLEVTQKNSVRKTIFQTGMLT